MFIIPNTLDLSKAGVYAIINKNTGNIYIGKTLRSFKKRLFEHKFNLEHETFRDNIRLTNEFIKHPEYVYECSIIETLSEEFQYICNHKNAVSEEQLKEVHEWLNKTETYWIDYYRCAIGKRNVYNRADGGNHVYKTRSIKQRIENMSISQKQSYATNPDRHKHASSGQYERYKNPNEKQKTADSLNKYWSKEESRKKARDSQKRKWAREEEHIKLSIATKEASKRPEVKQNRINGQRISYSKPERRILQTEVNRKSRKRMHEKYLYEVQACNDILHLYFELYPKAKKLPLIHKKQLILDIAEKITYIL